MYIEYVYFLLFVCLIVVVLDEGVEEVLIGVESFSLKVNVGGDDLVVLVFVFLVCFLVELVGIGVDIEGMKVKKGKDSLLILRVVFLVERYVFFCLEVLGILEWIIGCIVGLVLVLEVGFVGWLKLNLNVFVFFLVFLGVLMIFFFNGEL